jgi:acetyl esterase/lipase
MFTPITTSGNIKIIFMVFLLLTIAACSTTPPATTKPMATPTATPTFSRLFSPHYQVTLKPNVAYGSLPDQILDLCTPSGLSTPRPGIVLIHGGGFVGGDKRYQFDDQDTLFDVCMGLASQGFVVASINYRLAPASTWPSSLVDAQLAVRWLRTHASEIKLDPQRLCSAGLSAGAYLAVFLGVLQTIHTGDQASLLATQSPHVSCVVDFYGPVDLARLVKTAPGPNQEVVQALLDHATPESNPKLYHDASPLFYVASQSAPTLIIHGTHDMTVPIEQSQSLQSALQQHDVPVEYITYAGEHSLGGIDEQQIRGLWGQAVAFLVAHE